MTKQCHRPRNQGSGNLRLIAQRWHHNADKGRQHGKVQPPTRQVRHTLTKQCTNQRARHPGQVQRQGHAGVVPLAVLSHATGEITALHYGKGLIGQAERQRHPPTLRQLADIRLQRSAVEHMAQIDHQCGEQNHQCAATKRQ